jgi:DNA repair exonuclease SbcCD ATPase subunit
MRFERVQAFGFGGLPEGATLELAEGLTVVVGPNEAAKSTWHAALYAALCGRRRAQGAGKAEDRLFRSRHRPWAGGIRGWRVVGILSLADGSRVQIDQDLEHGVKCKATDLALNRNLTQNIIHEGTPDGAAWLGLDRRSFASTACIRQAEILSVLEGADTLQGHLQRAAATAGTDETAGEALRLLTAYAKEHVGQESKASTRPLQRAITGVRLAEEQLVKAQDLHRDYVDLARSAEKAEAEANQLRNALQAAEAAFKDQQQAAIEARQARRAAVAEEAQKRADQAQRTADEARAALELTRSELREAAAAADRQVESARAGVVDAREKVRTSWESAKLARESADGGLRQEMRSVGERLVAEAFAAVQQAEAHRERARELASVSLQEAADKAREAAETAKALRQAAREAFDALTAAGIEAADAEDRHSRAARDVREVERALGAARAVAQRARDRVVAVGELSSRAGSLVRGPMKEHASVAQVAAALQAWEGRARSSPLDGPTSEDLQAQWAALPEMPEGDLEPVSDVTVASEELRSAAVMRREHETAEPALPLSLPLYDEAELEQLATRLGAVLKPEQNGENILSLQRKLRTGLAFGGVVALVALLGLFVVGILALAFVPLAIAASVYSSRTRQRFIQARAAYDSDRSAVARASADRVAAERKCAALGLAADPAALRSRIVELAVQRAEANRAQAGLDKWLATGQRMAADWPALFERLALALADRAVRLPESKDLSQAYDDYVAACRARAEQARRAAQRPSLETALKARQRAEADLAAIVEKEVAALEQVRDAAAVCGIHVTQDEYGDGLCAALRVWNEQRLSELAADEQAMQLWAQREQLLGGLTEEDLVALVESATADIARCETNLAETHEHSQGLLTFAEFKTASHEQALAAQGLAEQLAAEADEAGRQTAAPGRDRDGTLMLAEQSLDEAQNRHSEAVAQAARLVETAVDDFEPETLVEWAAAILSDEHLTAAEAALEMAEATAKTVIAAGQHQLDELSQVTDDATEKHLQAERALSFTADQDESRAEIDDGTTALKTALHDADDVAAERRGSVEERRRYLIGVAESEEELAQARGELTRVRELQQTLETTRVFLGKAQDVVHKNVAPLIAAIVRDWLPVVTGGRYVDCTLNPSTLQMTVFDDKRQDYDVELLSRGTLEQVYLLLRVALADLLVQKGETCPLLLDDVTVQSDSERKKAMLCLLQELSRDRQIVLFSQEAEVAAWAEAHLGSRDSLVRLEDHGRPAQVPVPRSGSATLIAS